MIFSAIASAIGAVATGVGSAVGALGAGGGAGALSGIAGLVGTGVQAYGAMQANKGAKKAEELRMRQMNLEAARERRQVVRQSVIARSEALSNATAQGAQGGSGLQGGFGQIANQQGQNTTAINQGQEIGMGMFAANKQISTGQTYQSIGGAIQNFGSFLNSNYEQNRRVTGFA